MRYLTVMLTILVAGSLAAQEPADLSPADSALVGRILSAEDRRDSTAVALTVGANHSNPRIRILARRAGERITDPAFQNRDSFPPLPAPPDWPEPAWRLRYRVLTDRSNDCAAFARALSDSAWPVRLRAADIVPATCAADKELVAKLHSWIDSLPADVSRGEPGHVSWHAAAHALVALSRLQPEEARPLVRQFATHPEWHLRLYSAKAASALADTGVLRDLAHDTNPNVRESAIQGLSKLTGHADDDIYVEALSSDAPQVVRAAAIALSGSTDPGVRKALDAAFDRWVRRGSDTERDVRVALLEAMGRPAIDDRPPRREVAIPQEAIALALGADVRLKVTMAESGGGGSFVVRLRGDVAPITAARILELAEAGYYDGLAWHRVEPDFVVQGGSPLDNEYSGLDTYFRDELGTVPHVRGTVGMSTRGHDTGDAQWFINLKDNLRLNSDYTVFAEVVEGIDVVDGIMEGDTIAAIERVETREGSRE